MHGKFKFILIFLCSAFLILSISQSLKILDDKFLHTSPLHILCSVDLEIFILSSQLITTLIRTMPEQSKLLGSNGQVSRQKYEELETLFCAQRKRLNALSHIPQVIADKEYEARHNKERANTYENQYHEVHRMYTNLVRTLSTQGQNYCPNCSTVQYKQEKSGRSDENVQMWSGRNVATPMESLQLTSDPGQHPSMKSTTDASKLQMDCAAPIKRTVSHVEPLQKASLAGISEQFEQQSGSVYLMKSQSHPSGKTLVSPVVGTVASKGPTAPASREDTQPSVSRPHTQTQHAKSPLLRMPEVSKKNFDRLATEYTRMKHAVEKIEKEQDVDMRKYLAVQEYEAVIAGLREDLQYARLQAEELRYINTAVTNKDMSRITQKCHDLQRKVMTLERAVKSNQGMITQLTDIIQKLKAQQSQTAEHHDTTAEHHDTSAGPHEAPDGQTMPAVDDLAKVPRCGLISNSAPHVPHKSFSENDMAGNEEVMRLTAQLAEMRAQLAEMRAKLDLEKQTYNSHISRMEQEIAELRVNLSQETQSRLTAEENYKEMLKSHEQLLSQTPRPEVECPESVQELLQEKNELKSLNSVLNHDLKNALEEKQVLLVQCQMFNEDFNRFQADYERNRKLVGELREQKIELEEKLSQTDPRRVQHMKEDIQRLRTELQKYRSQPPGYAAQPPPYQAGSLSSREQSSGYVSGGSSLAPSSDQGYGSGRSYLTASSSGYSSAGSSTQHVHQDEYVCQRCEAVFKMFEKDKFEEHKRKCVVE